MQLSAGECLRSNALSRHSSTVERLESNNLEVQYAPSSPPSMHTISTHADISAPAAGSQEVRREQLSI
jgi:hypothetical protein